MGVFVRMCMRRVYTEEERLSIGENVEVVCGTEAVLRERWRVSERVRVLDMMMFGSRRHCLANR